ncbi:MAG: T9SS type A sorting domain-containing protein [Chitinophagales bacterium]
MSKNLKCTLYKYSLSAIAFLTFRNSGLSQITYYDVDPDAIIDSDNSTYYLDINGDEVNDFLFIYSEFSLYSWPIHTYLHRRDIIAVPLGVSNAIAGTVGYHDTASGGTSWYYPFALEEATLINGDMQWQTYLFQVLGASTYLVGGGGNFYADNANWFNADLHETVDHFIGLKFKDSNDYLHYGWIRCDVIDSGRSLIIKDYAFNEEPDKGIYSRGLVSSVDTDQFSLLNLAYYGNTIRIDCSNTFIIELEIWSLSGEQLYVKNAVVCPVDIDISNLPVGLYVITLIADNSKRSVPFLVH